MKHVDLTETAVTQNPPEVAAKLRKRIDTFFAGGFEDSEDVLPQRMTQPDRVVLYGADDPVFASAALLSNFSAGFERNGFDRWHWQSTKPVRKNVRNAFDVAGQLCPSCLQQIFTCAV